MKITPGSGVAFLVSVDVVYTVMSSTNSSPQTTEINAAARAPTLMKWVRLGLIQGGGLIVCAIIFEPEDAVAFAAGGLLASGLMYAQYAHAKKAGLESCEPATEDYGPGPGQASNVTPLRTTSVTPGQNLTVVQPWATP